MAEHYGNEVPNDRLAGQSSPSADPSPDREHQPDVSTARDMADEFDTLVALLRQPVRPDSFSQESACRRAVEAIRQMGRTASPSDLDPAVSVDGQMPALRALGQYQLIEKLGEGGMGAVYRALHTRLEKVVAVKVMSAGRVDDPEAIARFDREMRAVGRLNHPNIVGAFDAGEADGSHYLVMELVDGHDLGAIVRRTGPLPVADACEAIRQAAVGLDHAHSHGLVHRDVKPSNLMVTRQGEVKLLDLGLARLAEQVPGGVELTSTGQMMGTFDYMAPEQGSDSHAVDHRADVYALGATLYKLLAGRAPFAGPQYGTPMKRMMALATEDPTPIRQLRPDVPKDLARVIHRMLARDPGRRPATGREAADLLAPCAAGSDLAGLVARVDEAAPKPSAEPGTASTQPAAPSAMEHTPHTIQISPPAAFGTEAGRLRRLAAWFGGLPPIARFGLTAAAGAVALVLLAVLLTLQTPHGTLVIESDDPNIEVLVKQNGEVIDILSADRGWKVGLQDGKYDVTLSGGADRMQLSEDQVTLTRGGQAVLRVTTQTRPDARASAVSTLAAPIAPFVDGDWVRLSNRMSDFCIGVNGASTEPRASLHQYAPVPGALEQHWRIESSEQPGLYRLKNRKSGLYVTLKQPRQGEGYLQRPFEEDNSEFLFSILDIDGKWFRIVSQESKLDAAIWGASMREGEWIIQWPFSVGATDKYWRVEPVDEGREHGWVDVLAETDPQQHSVFGTWRRDGSRLVCDPLDFTRIGSPVYVTRDYEVEVQFRWIGKVGEVNLLLPAGDSAVHVWVKPGSGGLGQFSGARPAPPAKTWTYEADRRYTLAATVRVDGATATIETRMDGEPYAEWSGPVESLYPRSDWMIPNRTVGFGAHVCNVSLEGLRVRPLEGGQLLRKTYRVEPVEIEPGQTIELAALVDPVRHAVLGKWEVADGEIMCVAPREFARVAIPLVPRGDYELSGTLLRPKGLSPATLAIPVGRSYTGLEIKDKAVLLERVGASPPWKRADVQMGPETQFAVRVEHQGDIAKIHVAIDGKPALDWEGPTVAAQPRFDWVLTLPSLAVGTHGGLLVVKDLKFKLLSGSAERIVEEVEPIATAPSIDSWLGLPFPAAGTVEEQKAWVVAELKRLNAGYDGEATFEIEDGRIVGLHVSGEHLVDITPLQFLSTIRNLGIGPSKVADLSPLRKMPLERLNCASTKVTDLTPLKGMKLRRLRCERTTLSDLSPLTGMPLEQLDVGITEVSDLSPLRGMPLVNLSCGFSQVADLSPLKGMPLERLDCGCTPIADLSPLEGMPLRELYVFGTKVSDLTPITQLPLEQLDCNFVPKRDLDAIRSITTLRRFKGRPAAEVLREAEEKLKQSDSDEPAEPAQPFPEQGSVEEQKARMVPGQDAIPYGPFDVQAVLAKTFAHKDAAVAAVAFLPDGRNVLTAGEDGKVRVWDIEHARTLETFEAGLESVRTMACTPDGSLIAVAGDAGLIVLLDRKSGQSIHRLNGHEGGTAAMAFTPDGTVLITGDREGENLHLWDAVNGKRVVFFSGHQGGVKGLAVTSDGERLISCGADGHIKFWDLETRQQQEAVATGEPITCVAFALGDKRPAFATAHASGKVTVRDAETGEVRLSFESESPIRSLSYTRCGRLLAAACDDGYLRLWHAHDGREALAFQAHDGAVLCAAYSGDADLWLTGGADCTAKAWRMAYEPKTAADDVERWVRSELKWLNPQMTNPVKFGRRDGTTVSMEAEDGHLNDASPLQVLSDLESFTHGGNRGMGISDLSPLQGLPVNTIRLIGVRGFSDLSMLAGLPLKDLYMWQTPVTDLSPLKGLPIERLALMHMNITDLSVLHNLPLKSLNIHYFFNGNKGGDVYLEQVKGLKLEHLECSLMPVTNLDPIEGMPLVSLNIVRTNVTDLSVLRGMPLKRLRMLETDIPDLSPLQDVPMEELWAPIRNMHDIESLRAIPTLEQINGQPAGDALRKAEEQLQELQTLLGPEATELYPSPGTGAAQARWITNELKRANPGFDGKTRFGFGGGDVWFVELDGKDIDNLRPLQPLRHLKTLHCNGSAVTDLTPLAGKRLEVVTLRGSKVSDLAPLRGGHLRQLDLSESTVRDLSPLIGIPIEVLRLRNVQGVTDFRPLKLMPLKELNVGGTKFDDSTLLEGMPLERLDIQGTAVKDLSPLHSAKLTRLAFNGTAVSDLSPLAGMPLQELHCEGAPVKDFAPLLDTELESITCDLTLDAVAILRQIKTLKTVNDRPAEEALLEAEVRLEQTANEPEEPDAVDPAN